MAKPGKGKPRKLQIQGKKTRSKPLPITLAKPAAKPRRSRRSRKAHPNPQNIREDRIGNAIHNIGMKGGRTEGETFSVRMNAIRGLMAEGFLNQQEAEIVAKRMHEGFVVVLSTALNGFLSKRIHPNTRKGITKPEHLPMVFRVEAHKKIQRFGFLGEEAIRSSFNAAISNNAIALDEPTVRQLYEILDEEIERQKKRRVIT